MSLTNQEPAYATSFAGAQRLAMAAMSPTGLVGWARTEAAWQRFVLGGLRRLRLWQAAHHWRNARRFGSWPLRSRQLRSP